MLTYIQVDTTKIMRKTFCIHIVMHESHNVNRTVVGIYDFFSNIKTPAGTFFKVVKIPALISGTTIYSHTNSLIVNKHVIVPTYNSLAVDTNTDALRIYKETMPGYTIVDIDTQMLLSLAGGAIHCTTMQVPQKQSSF